MIVIWLLVTRGATYHAVGSSVHLTPQKELA